MTELQKIIKANHKKITNTRKTITDKMKQLQKDIEQQSMLLDSFRESTKGGYLSDLSDLLKIKLHTASEMNRTFKALSRRNKIDKLFLEQMEIIESKERRKPKKTKSPSVLLTTGNLVSKVREMNEKHQMSNNDKRIVKEMIQQLEKEL